MTHARSGTPFILGPSSGHYSSTCCTAVFHHFTESSDRSISNTMRRLAICSIVRRPFAIGIGS
jgi:hypothetical protein